MNKIEAAQQIDFFAICPLDVLILIFKEVVKIECGICKPSYFRVSKKAHKACTKVNEGLFERIKGLFSKQIEVLFPPLEQNLKGLIEKKLPLGKGWEKMIHQETSRLLSYLGVDAFESFHQNWIELLVACGVNATSSLSQTPLLQICEHALKLIEIKEERIKKEKDLLVCLESILKKGANPNFNGFPASPLVLLISQSPFSQEDIQFINQMLSLLCWYGADPFRPSENRYGVTPSPYEYVENNRQAYKEGLKKSTH